MPTLLSWVISDLSSTIIACLVLIVVLQIEVFECVLGWGPHEGQGFRALGDFFVCLFLTPEISVANFISYVKALWKTGAASP